MTSLNDHTIVQRQRQTVKEAEVLTAGLGRALHVWLGGVAHNKGLAGRAAADVLVGVLGLEPREGVKLLLANKTLDV